MLRRDGSYGFCTGGYISRVNQYTNNIYSDKFNPVEASIVGQSGLQNASVLVKK